MQEIGVGVSDCVSNEYFTWEIQYPSVYADEEDRQ